MPPRKRKAAPAAATGPDDRSGNAKFYKVEETPLPAPVSQFAGVDFYTVLNVPKDASLPDIKRAYRSLALKYHPDRNAGNKRCERDFQVLARIMETLGDAKRRKEYDRVGEVGDDDESSVVVDDRSVFRKVTTDDIDAYAKTYRESKEEKADVLRYYAELKGDMVKMMEWIPLSSGVADVARFDAMVVAAIASKELKSYTSYRESVRDAKLAQLELAAEADEAKAAKEEIVARTGVDVGAATDEKDLRALIVAKRETESSRWMAYVEEKYRRLDAAEAAASAADSNSKSKTDAAVLKKIRKSAEKIVAATDENQDGAVLDQNTIDALIQARCAINDELNANAPEAFYVYAEFGSKGRYCEILGWKSTPETKEREEYLKQALVGDGLGWGICVDREFETDNYDEHTPSGTPSVTRIAKLASLDRLKKRIPDFNGSEYPGLVSIISAAAADDDDATTPNATAAAAAAAAATVADEED